MLIDFALIPIGVLQYIAIAIDINIERIQGLNGMHIPFLRVEQRIMIKQDGIVKYPLKISLW